MGKFRISDKMTEEDCRSIIAKLLEESATKYSKNDYEEAAKMLVAAAKVMLQIQTIARKEQRRQSVNDSIKKQRDKKVKEQKEYEEARRQVEVQTNQKNESDVRRNPR